ncbi:hypothetical protein IWQ60_001140 [Tieghemiomyces parasiticus]|uniref:MOSC domain-containing protein n=1 Tax=Tieghemiomyces parasiticus TaxID=78921 RepID=A0A9W8ADI5_9FUNG|nr:hypothetical protein IWQ60_001140 [Tieghemiomyces parasiticus]
MHSFLGQYFMSHPPNGLNEQVTEATVAPTDRDIRVSQLFVYPVKSCRGISVQTALITKYGFRHDRYWVVTDENYRFLSQKDEGRLVLIQPTLHEDPPSLSSSNPEGGPVKPYLALNVVDGSQPEIRVPLYPDSTELQALKPCKVTVFLDQASGYDLGDEVAAWFSRFLGRSVRLVRRAEFEVRRIHTNVPSDELLEVPAQTAFANDAPFLLASEASMQDVNDHLDEKIDIRHFRPNIMVDGCSAFEEEAWKRIHLQRLITTAEGVTATPALVVDLLVTSRCTRCPLTNTNPDTGVPSPNHQPLKTIVNYRRVDPGAKFRGCFGMNCVPVRLGQMISVGDWVVVKETGKHFRISEF